MLHAMTSPRALESFEFRDPGTVVTEVLAQLYARAGDAYLVLVREPSGLQLVEQVVQVDTDQWQQLDRYDRSQLLADSVDAMPVPEWTSGSSPRHAVMTIVVRNGLAVLGGPEADWLFAWRYANTVAHVFKGDLVLVTEHGWTDFMTGWGATSPRLVAGAPR